MGENGRPETRKEVRLGTWNGSQAVGMERRRWAVIGRMWRLMGDGPGGGTRGSACLGL